MALIRALGLSFASSSSYFIITIIIFITRVSPLHALLPRKKTKLPFDELAWHRMTPSSSVVTLTMIPLLKQKSVAAWQMLSMSDLPLLSLLMKTCYKFMNISIKSWLKRLVKGFFHLVPKNRGKSVYAKAGGERKGFSFAFPASHQQKPLKLFSSATLNFFSFFSLFPPSPWESRSLRNAVEVTAY